MGFTTGFLGGLTLTYSVLYLTIYLHKANRNVQHTLLAQSHILLNSIYEPLPPEPLPPAYEVRKAGLTEILKDRWNSEVEKMVRNVQETNWREKREELERRVGNVWGNVRETEKAQELEQRFKENVVGTGENGREEAREGIQNIREGLRGGVQNMKEGLRDGARSVKEGVEEGTTQKRLLEQ